MEQPTSSSKPSDTANAYSETVSKLQAIIQLSPGRIRWTGEGYLFHDLQRMLHAWHVNTTKIYSSVTAVLVYLVVTNISTCMVF